MSELGHALKTARESKEMSLEELQDITKIQKRYLQALENGDFKQLPGDFYTRAFIKSYAESVGLDSQAFFDEHANEIPKPRQEPIDTMVPSRAAVHRPKKRTVRKSKAQSSKTASIIPKLLIIVFILIVLVAVWLVAQFMTKDQPKSSPAQTNKTTVSYKKDDSQSASSKDTKNSKTKQDKQTPKKTDEPKPKMSLTKDKMDGSKSYYTLTNADSFDVKIESSTGSPSWISAVNTSTNKKYAFGLVDDKNNFSFDASDASEISIKVGSVPNTKITINGEAFKFPSDQVTQKIFITYKK